MFYALLDLLVCPVCRKELVLVFPDEAPGRTVMRMPPAQRMGPAGAAVGPMPATSARSTVAMFLRPRASSPVSDGRDREQVIVSGLLVCPDCGRWFPVRESLPELLPDHLRYWDEDLNFLESFRPRARKENLELLIDRLTAPPPDLNSRVASSASATDPGAIYKRAELSVTRPPLPEGFFGPAALAPFNPCAPSFSLSLMGRYAAAVPLLRAPLNGLVFDLGCGYGWTTEWLVRLGYRAVGLDLNRDYILAGRPRMGTALPHLVVGDVENIPLGETWADAVLSYDAFHHIPGRRKALAELDRIMRPGTKIALIEPGAGHEDHPRSVAVMKQLGILERGLDPADLLGDLDGTKLGNIVRHPFEEESLILLTIEKEGTFETDSRAPRDLIADMTVDPGMGAVESEAGDPVKLVLFLENAGDTTWLREAPGRAGTVRLGVKLLDEDKRVLADEYARLQLPRDISPRQGLRLGLQLPPISKTGRYFLEFDPVDEWFLWFKDYDYRPYRVPIEIKKSGTGSGFSESGPATASEFAFYSILRRIGDPPSDPEPAIQTTPPGLNWTNLWKKGSRRIKRLFRSSSP